MCGYFSVRKSTTIFSLSIAFISFVPLCLCVCARVLGNVRYIRVNPLSMVVFVVNLISIERCQKSLFVTLLLTYTHTSIHVEPSGREASE